MFTFFYQASLDQGKILDDWKTANAVPIFKNVNKPENELQTHIIYFCYLQDWSTLCA